MDKITEITNKLGVFGTLGAGLALALAVAVLGFIYLISPYQEEIAKKKVAVEATEKKVAKLKILSEDREMITNRGAEIYANFLKASRLLPSAEQISQVIEAIEGKANQNGTQVLSFDAFKVGIKSAAAPEVSERVVEGEIGGSHESLVGFLRAISYYERITEVRAISEMKDQQGRQKLKFVLAAYYMPSTLKVPEEMRRRAMDILNKEGFELDQPTKLTAAATVPQNR